MKPFEENWVLLETEAIQDGMMHRELAQEYAFYKAVVDGDLEAVLQNCKENKFIDSDGVGVLSRDPVVNIKYHFVVGTALITRHCCQNGMELERAFRLSDYYISKLDDLYTVNDVHLLHDEMVCDFTNKMRMIKRSDAGSKHVNACKNYIFAHVQERIFVEDIAETLKVSPTYLSRIFKQETGTTISKYVIQQKVKLAMNLLKYSDASVEEVADKYAFSSQSHFIKQFKELVGLTPGKYREKYYMTME